MKNLWKYYIGVFEDGTIKYLTRLGDGNFAFWEEGKKAKEFTVTVATDICKGLNMNFIPAVVIKAPTFMNLSN